MLCGSRLVVHGLYGCRLDDENQESDDLKLCNDDHESQVENLINLPYLHEPAILHSLECRYHQSNIYTYTGPILIAVNPFKSVPLYTTQILESYYNMGLLKSQGIESANSAPLSPHVYAIADAAYRDMMRIVKEAGPGKEGAKVPANQCVLISGESGAGKTESTKIVLKYLTTVGSSTGSVKQETGSVMDKILQSNPILEAFGNARTLRNDNSSRFGKFIELNFNRRGVLIGGRIRTYLLEKVRLPCQQLGERNFHVFYQMAAGGNAEEKALWQLMPLQELWYTSQGEIYELRHVDDGDEFNRMKTALNTLNFPVEHQEALFRVMAGLLHLGQLQFQADASGEGSVTANEPDVLKSLQTVASLLAVSKEELENSLTKRVITARNETVVKNLSPVQASDARDAVARAIYGKIFDWIVRTINSSIEVDMTGVRADIGVLDIFGFECFKNNSFEQLCINYTNETLQQQFNQFVFKLEQKEYEAEKIEWSFISFPDNQDCLDLIEHKQKGLLAMLDDECRLPGASDEKFASRLYKAYGENNRFSATAAQKRDSMFCIRHYAGQVVYCTRTFVEKNKDELPKEAENLMVGSSVGLLGLVFAHVAAPAPVATSNAATSPRAKSGGETGKAVSVSSQFKEQLASLMEKIYATAPHYIRCLKPNDENAPDNFNRRRTTEQLRYGGVLEAVRVARSGFPVRLTHADFYTRYRCLANPFNPVTAALPRYIQNHLGEARYLCEKLLETLWDDTVPSLDPADKIPLGRNRRVSRVLDVSSWKGKLAIPRESLQLGLNKVFLRKSAHDLLESRRSRRLNSFAVRIQSVVRSFRLRSKFMTIMWAVRTVQRVVRGTQARVEASKLRYQKSAKRLQTCYRRFIARKKFTRFMKAVVAIQNLKRGKFARTVLRELRYLARVKRLQRTLRRLVAQHKFLRLRRACTAMQCRLRRYRAMNELQQLKAAAKDLGMLKQSNEALKAEIEQLRARAAEDAKRMMEKASAAKDVEYHRVVQELADLKENFQSEYKMRLALETKLASSEASLATARSKLAASDENNAAMEGLLNKLHGEMDRLKQEASETDYQLQEMSAALRQSQEETNDLANRLSDAEEALYRASLDMALRAKHDGSAAQAPAVTSLAALAFPSVESTPMPTATPTSVPTLGGDDAAAQELFRERTQRQALEEEVSRLRYISTDLRAQVESLRRNNANGVQTGLARKADDGPKRKSSLRGSFESDTSNPPSAGSPTMFSPQAPVASGVGSKPPLARKLSPPPPPTVQANKRGSAADLAHVAAVAELYNFGEDDEHDTEEDDASQASNTPFSGGVSRSTSGASSTKVAPPSSGAGHQQSNVRRGSSGSNEGGGSSSATLGQQAAAVASTNAAMDMFEKNLDAFKSKLKGGVRAHVWDGAKVARLEVTLKLNALGDGLIFEVKRGYFSFGSKNDIAPVKYVFLAIILSYLAILDHYWNAIIICSVLEMSTSVSKPRK
jgi:myosin-5